MPTKILLPALSSQMTEATLVTWLKKEGEKVAAGDILAEAKTDKATFKIEAVESGVLSRILIAEGTQNVPVNAPIGLIHEDGEDLSVPKPEEVSTQHLVLLSVGENKKDVYQAIEDLYGEVSLWNPYIEQLASDAGGLSTEGLGSFFTDDETIPTPLAVYGSPEEIRVAKEHVKLFETLGATVEVRMGHYDGCVVLTSVGEDEKALCKALSAMLRKGSSRSLYHQLSRAAKFRVAAHLHRHNRLDQLKRNLANMWAKRKAVNTAPAMLPHHDSLIYCNQYDAERIKEVLEGVGATVEINEVAKATIDKIYSEERDHESSLMACPACDKQVSKLAGKCPHCGHSLSSVFDPKTPHHKILSFLFKCVVVIILLLILWFIVIPVVWWLIKAIFIGNIL